MKIRHLAVCGPSIAPGVDWQGRAMPNRKRRDEREVSLSAS